MKIDKEIAIDLAEQRKINFEYSERQLQRLLDWMNDKNKQSANTAFTSGTLRNCAYKFEEVLNTDTEKLLSEAREEAVRRYDFGVTVKGIVDKSKSDKHWGWNACIKFIINKLKG